MNIIFLPLTHCEIFPSNGHIPFASALPCPQNRSRISVVAMNGASIFIQDVSETDTILSLKERVFALNCKMYVRRQRLVYSAGPHGMNALADNETLGGAGVAQDGTAKFDVLLVDLTAVEMAQLDIKVNFLTGILGRHRCV